MSSDAFILQGTIDVNVDDAVNGLKKVDKEVDGSGNTIDGFKGKLGGIAKMVVAAFSIKAIADFGKSCIDAAEALERTNKKTDVIFAEMSQDAKDWALNQERYFGMGSGTIQGYMNGVADITQGMGMAKDESYEMSKGVVELATQLANWNGIETSDAINDIQSALTGSTKRLEKYGVKINDAAKEQAMLSLGLTGTYDKLDNATKAQVIYQATMEASGNAIEYWNEGNRSMGFYLNEAKEQFGNITETIGGIFLPIAKKATEKFADFVSNLNLFVTGAMEAFGKAKQEFEDTGNFVDGLAVFIKETFGVDLPQTFYYMVDDIVLAFQTLWQVVLDIWDTVGKPIFDGIVAIFDNIKANSDIIFGAVSTAFGIMSESVKVIWESILKPVFEFFIDIIKLTKEWFEENFGNIWDIFYGFVQDIKGIWENNLKPCFEAIGTFIKEVLLPAFKYVFENGILPAVGNVFRTIGELWNNSLKPILTGIIDFITGVFSGSWSSAWSGVVSIFGGIWEGLKTVAKAPLNGIISLVNSAIRQLNKISVTIPSWVPMVGGNSYGVNLKEISYLENGGILTQPTMLSGNVMAGEKNKGRQGQAEAVIPLDRLFKEMDRLYGKGKEIVINVDGRRFMRAVAPYQKELDSYNRRSAKFAY